jgi:hypothetical protein
MRRRRPAWAALIYLKAMDFGYGIGPNKSSIEGLEIARELYRFWRGVAEVQSQLDRGHFIQRYILMPEIQHRQVR